MSTTFPERQRGFGIIAAIVILVILAGLSAFIVAVTTTQNITLAQDVQAARAYKAAQAGIEWGIARWLETSPSDTARCGASTPQIDNLDGFWVKITTTLTTTTTTPVLYYCTIQATAWPTGMTASDSGKLGFVERQLTAVVEGF
jgi:MSHA biogenesis protein MshP